MAGQLKHPRTTRLAPSPTGALHLGNARTFVLTWWAARSEGAKLRFRMEDIDGPRKKREAAEQAIEDLQWLGLDWDGEVLVQTSRLSVHQAQLQQLADGGHIYPCTCTRRDVESAQSAPHAGEDLQYPGTCRNLNRSVEEAYSSVGRPVAWRFRVPNLAVNFHDEVLGDVSMNPQQHGGDFVIGRYDPKQGGTLPGYQLAVVSDDHFQGIDWVLRGDDLVSSTPRQILIQEALGHPKPRYGHFPLVVGEDGRRLAKRHGDTRIAALREAGVPALGILQWVAKSVGLSSDYPNRYLDEPLRLSRCKLPPTVWTGVL